MSDNLLEIKDLHVNAGEKEILKGQMYQHTSLGLCGYYKQYTKQVGGKSGPGRIGNSHNRTVNK